MARLEGEALVVRKRIQTGQPGRQRVGIRKFGDTWLPWGDAAGNWGARVDAVICYTEKKQRVAQTRFPSARIWNFTEGIQKARAQLWWGVLAGTLSGVGRARHFCDLLDNMRPAVGLVAIHGNHSRRELAEWFPVLPSGYRVVQRIFKHSELRGGTDSRWYVRMFVWQDPQLGGLSLHVEKSLYPRSLAMFTDDTIGADAGQIDL